MTHLVVTVSVVFLFIAFILIPGYMSRLSMEQKMSDMRYRLNEHKSLQPLYDSLKKPSQPDLTDLVVLPGTRLHKDDVSSALDAIRNIALKSGMKVIYLAPDFNNISKDASSLALNVSLKGDFLNFRKVLANIGALPYVESAEEFSILREPNSRMTDFKIKIILGVG